MTSSSPIVIVGGGLAGATAATELREQGYDGDLILYAAEPHVPYERPPLSKDYLLGNAPLDDTFVHAAAWYSDNRVDLRTGTSVTAIDTANRRVRTDDGEQAYATLLLATGAAPRRLASADDASTPVAYLRTIEDSDRLKEELRADARIAIVGAGWIGLEVASAARQKDARVTVFETAALPLLKVLGPEVAEIFAGLHRAHGVDLRLDTAVTGDDLAGADLVMVGIGAVPNTGLAEDAGLAVDDGIVVDAQLRTSDPSVFAVGDVARHQHPGLRRPLRVEHWDNAIEQAKVAARNMLGGAEPYTRQPYFFTDQYDLGMEYVGTIGPDGYDRVDIEGDTDVVNGGAFRAYWVSGGAVVAAMHANDWDNSDAIRASIGTLR